MTPVEKTFRACSSLRLSLAKAIRRKQRQLRDLEIEKALADALVKDASAALAKEKAHRVSS